MQDDIDSPNSPNSPDSPKHFHDEVNFIPTESTNDIIRNAKTATEKEQKMTLLQGIKLYPKAVAWSLLISTCICMEGYDVCLLSNFCECRLIAST
jgi:MFS transporter, SP family, general alpha glucoside:H+ symporter